MSQARGTRVAARDAVRIVAGRYEARHPRSRAGAPPSTLPEHRALHVAAVAGKRATRYLQREHLLPLGGDVLAYLTELVHRRPRVWVRDVERLHDLLERHGDAALRIAFSQALSAGVFGHEYVAHHLPPTTPNAMPAARALSVPINDAGYPSTIVLPITRSSPKPTRRCACACPQGPPGWTTTATYSSPR